MKKTAIRSLVPMALGLMAAGGVCAEANPYYIGVSAGYTHESNVYRVEKSRLVPTPDGARAAPSDHYWSVGLLAGLDQPIGRQRLYANGRVQSNRYQALDNLDNVSYGLAAGVDWETVENLSGNLNLSVSENLMSYADAQTPGADKNLVRNTAFSARAQYGLVSLLSLEAVVVHREIDNSSDQLRFRNTDLSQNAVSLGLKYRPSGALTLGAAVRVTRGDYPVDSFDRKDLDLTALWLATGQSDLNARLSFSKQDNTLRERDISGVTGALGWVYRPTGKLTFRTLISRDTGAETAFILTQAEPGQASTAASDSSRLSSALSLSAAYAATSKIRIDLLGRYVRRSLVEGNVTGKDILKTLTLGATYVPTRSLQFACNVGREVRHNAGTLSYGYVVNTAGCSAQFVIQ